MKLSDLRSADEIHEQDMLNPEYRREYERLQEEAMTAPRCRDCGCDWPPCARRGECVSPVRWWLWRLAHPRAYRRYRDGSGTCTRAETEAILNDPGALAEIREAQAEIRRGEGLRGAEATAAIKAKRAQLVTDLLDDAQKLRRQPPEGTAPLAPCRPSVP